MINFLAKKYNSQDQYITPLVNRFLTEEVLLVASSVDDIPENANELYYKINDKYYDPIEICAAIEIIELRNEIAATKGITLK
jgi:hypothetical protein